MAIHVMINKVTNESMAYRKCGYLRKRLQTPSKSFSKENLRSLAQVIEPTFRSIKFIYPTAGKFLPYTPNSIMKTSTARQLRQAH